MNTKIESMDLYQQVEMMYYLSKFKTKYNIDKPHIEYFDGSVLLSTTSIKDDTQGMFMKPGIVNISDLEKSLNVKLSKLQDNTACFFSYRAEQDKSINPRIKTKELFLSPNKEISTYVNTIYKRIKHWLYIPTGDLMLDSIPMENKKVLVIANKIIGILDNELKKSANYQNLNIEDKRMFILSVINDIPVESNMNSLSSKILYHIFHATNNIHMAISNQFSFRYYWFVQLGFDDTLSFKILTDNEGAKTVFRLRDIPSGKKRRTALYHWVHEHYRNVPQSDKLDTVFIKSYLRGEQNFQWGDLRCQIIPSEYDIEKYNKIWNKNKIQRK